VGDLCADQREVIIPALDSELVKIRLVKKGSPKLWSDERIEKFIRDMADKAKSQVTLEGKPQDVDFSRYIKDWAIRYGFSAQQAKAEIDKWVAEAEQGDDPYQLGLAAYAKKNFGEAGKLFEESATGKARRAREASATAQQLSEEAIRDFRLARDAHTNNYHFDQALSAYQKASELTSQHDNPRLWADLTMLVANAESNVGIRTEGERIHRHLANAVAAYHAALKVYTKAQLPQDWAMTQNNLGIVLSDQGTRTAGEEGTTLLAQAVAAYREALTVRTKAQLPQDWAMTQNNLGAVLRDQGTRTAGEAGKELIRQAISAYELALEIRTRQALPMQWEKTMSNLTIVKETLKGMK
jgi:tetratricopeptide (TPR) repeat protein